MRTLAGVLLAALLGNGCVSQDTPLTFHSDVEKLFDRVTRDTSAIIARYGGSRVHGVDEISWAMDVWYLPAGPEKALRAFGTPAASRLILAIEEPSHPVNRASFERLLAELGPPKPVWSEDPGQRDLDPEYYQWNRRADALKQPDHPLYRATYLRILSRIHSPAAGAAALRVLAREPDERVITECFRVLALLGDCRHAERLRGEFGRPGVRLKRLLWALAMLGDQKAAADYLSLVEGLVRIRPLVPSGGAKNPVPDIPSAAAFVHVLQHDDPIDMTRDLTEDLADVSLMRDSRAIRILIEALSSHRKQVLHTSEYLLEQILDVDLRRQTGVPWRDPGALYTLRMYHAMVRWWETAGPKLRWDSTKRKFALVTE